MDMDMTQCTPHPIGVPVPPPSLAIPAMSSRALHLQKQQLLMSGPLK